jgi:hypothetical protein
MMINWKELIVYQVLVELVPSVLAVLLLLEKNLLLAFLREQGTVAQPFDQVHQQEELAAA